LVERCKRLGEWLRPCLEAVRERHALVAEARGRGLMWGLELREPSGTPAGHAASRVVVEALRRGIILLPAGPDGNVLELVPPYTITEQQLQHALDVLDACLTAVS